AQRVDRSSIATGMQIDATYVLTPSHTLSGGVYLAAEITSVQSTSSVLPAVGGVPTSDQPFSIFDSRGKTGYTDSVYLPDTGEGVWRVRVKGGVGMDGLDGFTGEWQLSPRLNGVWEATSTTTLHAGYARYFTPPRQEFVSTTSIAKFDNTTAASSVPINSTVR